METESSNRVTSLTELSNSGPQEGEGDEEEDGSGDNLNSLTTSLKKCRQTITGRGVTLSTLLADGIIESGKGNLSIDYLGQKFVADLLPSGKIRWQDTDEIFNSPSAWAIHCKKLVNPSKKSGCGWASVKYKGRKLDSWKTSWLRKQRQNGNQFMKVPMGLDNCDKMQKDSEEKMDSNTIQKVPDYRLGNLSQLKAPLPAHTQSSVINGMGSQTGRLQMDWSLNDIQEEALNLSMKQPSKDLPNESLLREASQQPFYVVKHSNLKRRHTDQDPNTLVRCELFESYGKFQPFTVSVTTNSMFLIDFHCHLTTSEVLGYLAGKWDQNSQHLNILQAFPCRCRLGDKECAPLVESEIRHRMNRAGLSLVGWYHSHPHKPATPTLRDIDCQMTYQLKMKGVGSMYHPCLGFIIAPYDNATYQKDSTFRAFWVMPPLEHKPSDYGIPMDIKFSIFQNPSLTEELLTEMKGLVDFYSGSPDVIVFKDIWHESVTYLQKIKCSLLSKLPQDQGENSSTLQFVHSLLLGK